MNEYEKEKIPAYIYKNKNLSGKQIGSYYRVFYGSMRAT